MIEEIRMAGKASGRMERINEEVRREFSEILRDEVKDPRIETPLLSLIHIYAS